MRANLLNQAITTAITLAAIPSSKLQLADGARSICAQANFVYGSGGVSCDAFLQTSFDNGVSWVDVCNFHFGTASARFLFNLSSLTPVTAQYTATDGTIAANTCKDGVLGNLFQVKLASTGTYAGGTNLSVDVVAQER
jgi:hypothetical protein